MDSRKIFTNQDIYILVAIVSHFPEGGHGGESFWRSMLGIYGDTLLKGRKESSLRGKWRKISKEHSGDLKEFKEKLEAELDPEFVKDVAQKLKDGLSGKELPARRKTSKVAKVQKPDVEEDKELPEDEEDIEDPDKKADPKAGADTAIVIQANLPGNQGGDTYVDLNQIIHKKESAETISKLAEDYDEAALSKSEAKTSLDKKMELAKHLILSKDLKENSVAVSDMWDICLPGEEPLYEKIDCTLEKLSKKYNKPTEELAVTLSQVSGNFAELERHLKGEPVTLWTDLEDMALKHPENKEMIGYLTNLKGALAVGKRKQFLGIP